MVRPDAEPVGRGAAMVGLGPPADLVAEKDGELAALRDHLAEIVRLTDLGPAAPVVSVVSPASSATDVLRAWVVETELRRRLDGFRIEPLSRPDLDRIGAGAPGRPDAVVAVGRLDDGLAARLRWLEVPVVAFGAPGTDTRWAGAPIGAPRPAGPGGWPAIPDPTLAGGDVYDAELLEQRVRFLRLTGVLPPLGDLLVAKVGAGGPPDELQGLAGRLRSHLVVVDGSAVPSPGCWQVGGNEPLDVAATVAAASAVVTDDAALLAAAVSFGRPAFGLATGGTTDLAAWFGDDPLVEDLGQVGPRLVQARGRAGDPGWWVDAGEALARAFDRLAQVLVGAAAPRSLATVPVRVLALQDRINALETTNAALQERLRAERVAFGARAAEALEARSRGPLRSGEGGHAWRRAERLQEEMAELRAENALLRAENVQLQHEAVVARQELAALLATKTLRAVAPTREIYRRLRSLAR